jgi:hypothetical protein
MEKKEVINKITNHSSDLMDKHFPKGECMERGKALVFNAEMIVYVSDLLEQELDKAREEGFVSGYVEANGDCNMLLKWKSYKQPKRTQVQAIKTTEEKQEKYLKKYIKLKQ